MKRIHKSVGIGLALGLVYGTLVGCNSKSAGGDAPKLKPLSQSVYSVFDTVWVEFTPEPKTFGESHFKADSSLQLVQRGARKGFAGSQKVGQYTMMESGRDYLVVFSDLKSHGGEVRVADTLRFTTFLHLDSDARDARPNDNPSGADTLATQDHFADSAALDAGTSVSGMIMWDLNDFWGRDERDVYLVMIRPWEHWHFELKSYKTPLKMVLRGPQLYNKPGTTDSTLFATKNSKGIDTLEVVFDLNWHSRGFASDEQSWTTPLPYWISIELADQTTVLGLPASEVATPYTLKAQRVARDERLNQ
jgi:hypothetical protein